MVGAVGLNGLATGAYIGAGMGPGPREGLTVGLIARGHAIRVVRAAIELSGLSRLGCSGAPSVSARWCTRPDLAAAGYPPTDQPSSAKPVSRSAIRSRSCSSPTA